MLDQIDAFFSLLDRGRATWNRYRGAGEETIAGRFIRLFEAHGVHRNQIPRFFGHGLTLKHVQSDSVLIEQLDETALHAACERFAVRREWLDGASDQVYVCRDFYKRPEDFLAFIGALAEQKPANEIRGALAFPERSDLDTQAALLLEEEIGAIEERTISRFSCLQWLGPSILEEPWLPGGLYSNRPPPRCDYARPPRTGQGD
ncbi:hypothetical protein [Thiocapsa sp.]|uniref:hypothetical protein n=1 Tax=Thiocapsa sp. TaxID=2024551 RepID=UPI003593E6D5